MYMIFPAAELVGQLYNAMLGYAMHPKGKLARLLLSNSIDERDFLSDPRANLETSRQVAVVVDRMRNHVWVHSAHHLENYCRGIIGALIQETLEYKMCWLKPRVPAHHEEYLHALFRRMWPGMDVELEVGILYHDVLDDFHVRITEYIGMAIPKPTWKIWYFTSFGNDYILQEGEDYRIVNWEQEHGYQNGQPLTGVTSGQLENQEVQEALAAQWTEFDQMLQRHSALMVDLSKFDRPVNPDAPRPRHVEEKPRIVMLTIPAHAKLPPQIHRRRVIDLHSKENHRPCDES